MNRNVNTPRSHRVLITLLVSSAVMLVGCESEPDSLEDVGEQIGDAVEDAGDAVEDALDG